MRIIATVALCALSTTASAANYLHRECVGSMARAYEALETLKSSQGKEFRAASIANREQVVPREEITEMIMSLNAAEAAIEVYIDELSKFCGQLPNAEGF